MALAIDPEATEPLTDAQVQASGDPKLAAYPILGHYDERGFPSPPPANSAGTILPGMGMTFQFGLTEAEPVGGYAFLPAGVYFIVECQKETAVASKKCKISIDWAEPQA
jgi:hypothetical protein